MPDKPLDQDLLKALLAAGQSPPPPPTLTTDRALPEIAREVYQTWLTPDGMLASMPYGLSNQEQLGRELRADRYLAAADEVIWIWEGFTGRDRFALLPGWIWSISMPKADSDFWRTGYMDAWVPKNPESASSFSGHYWRIYGVRSSAPGLLPQGQSERSAGDSGKPNVARADLQKWHDIFAAIHPNAAEALALQSSAAMFPNNSVPRQWVRDLRGPQKRGKPASRQE